MTGRCLVLGAGGRVGRLLRGVWADAAPLTDAVFQSRRPGEGIDLVSDLDAGLAKRLGAAPGFAALLVLPGVTYGTPSELAENADFALRALELAQALAIPRVMLCSSAAVYCPAPDHAPFRETDVTAPQRPYGQAKLAMEAAAAAWWSETQADIQITCLRMANMIGADMLALSARRATSEEPLKLDQFPDGGSPERAYLSPKTCAAVVSALASAPSDPGVTPLNLAEAGGAIAMHKVLESLQSNGFPVPWCWTPAPISAIRCVGLDTTRLRTRLPDCAAAHRQTSVDQLVAEWLLATGGRL